MNWYVAALKKYAEFTGRARRKEYWLFALFNFLICVVLVVIDSMGGMINPMGLGVLSGLYSLAVFVPSLAVSVRRLHDTDRSGWWLLILFVPVIGLIVFLVFMLLDSQPGENRHGPSPKAAAA
jgi:uncharacterized membrane protein YhaH (DUF805 family)